MSDNNNVSGLSVADEMFSYCLSDLLSEDGLRELIERHQFTPNDDNPHDVSDYQFFLRACINKRVNEGIIRCLLEYFPDSASATDHRGQLPLHLICNNPNVTLNIIQLLVDAAPASVHSVNDKGAMPLHLLCKNEELDESAALEILKLLIERHPKAVFHADNEGDLPIHYAAWGGRETKSPEFCRVLIESYPGSERITDVNGALPLHWACMFNTVSTVEYLYRLYPDAIHRATPGGGYPILAAILRVDERDDPIAAVGVVKFLLSCDPSVTLQKVGGKSLLHLACDLDYNDSNINAGIEVIKALYDAHPEAIDDNTIASTIQNYHQQVQAFINSQLVYSSQAKDRHVMTTPDGNGQLPLHTALQNNVRLGSIKLLVKGNPSATRNVDTNFAMPLHVACQHHNSAGVVQYLIGLDTSTLDAVDREGNTALHLACQSAMFETIAMLLETYDAVSVSKRNAHGKLPIDLLWESNDVLDRESTEYTESVFRLLKAYPEMVMVMNIDMQQQQSAAASCPSYNGKKRKFGNEE